MSWATWLLRHPRIAGSTGALTSRDAVVDPGTGRTVPGAGSSPRENVSRWRGPSLMMFDNVQWKEPHRMSLEDFCELNQRLRYGTVSRLVKESVTFEAGVVEIDPQGISVDTTRWNPPRGAAKGQFDVDLPLNGIRLSIFVFRPATELFVYRPVRPDVPYQKPDEWSLSGDSTWCRWVGASTRGPSHRNDDGVCREDDMAVWHDRSNGTLYLVVADGAGSAKYARVGSQTVTGAFIDFFKAHTLPDAALETASGVQAVREACLFASRDSLAQLIRRKDEIAAERGEAGLTLRAFHTTINVAIVQRRALGGMNVLSFAVGDGAVVLCPEHGAVRRLNMPDRGAFASQTEFVTSSGVLPNPSDDEALARFYSRRFEVASIGSKELGLGFVGLMTDGVCEDVPDWRAFSDAAMPFAVSQDGQALTTWLNGRNADNFDDKTLLMVSLK